MDHHWLSRCSSIEVAPRIFPRIPFQGPNFTLVKERYSCSMKGLNARLMFASCIQNLPISSNISSKSKKRSVAFSSPHFWCKWRHLAFVVSCKPYCRRDYWLALWSFLEPYFTTTIRGSLTLVVNALAELPRKRHHLVAEPAQVKKSRRSFVLLCQLLNLCNPNICTGHYLYINIALHPMRSSSYTIT